MNRLTVICAECRRPMGIKKMGVYILEYDANRRPYAIAAGDLLECPGCEKQVIARLGDQIPNWDGNFQVTVNAAKKTDYLYRVY